MRLSRSRSGVRLDLSLRVFAGKELSNEVALNCALLAVLGLTTLIDHLVEGGQREHVDPESALRFSWLCLAEPFTPINILR